MFTIPPNENFKIDKQLAHFSSKAEKHRKIYVDSNIEEIQDEAQRDIAKRKRGVHHAQLSLPVYIVNLVNRNVTKMRKQNF